MKVMNNFNLKWIVELKMKLKNKTNIVAAIPASLMNGLNECTDCGAAFIKNKPIQ